MLADIRKSTQERMKKSVASLIESLMKLRTGRAHPSLLQHISVNYYSHLTPLSQIANVAIENTQTLIVTPWESEMVATVEKAILNANLGLNPVRTGNLIRVPLPALTEARRKELVKIVRDESEKSRISVRNIRREANQDYKNLVKAKEISEDEEHRSQAEMQKMTDQYIAKIDQIVADKEKELMTI